MKAVIEIAPRGSVFDVAAEQIRAAEASPGYVADYHLSFKSARALFAELTPARIDLLESLRRLGPCLAYALARGVGRNYSNVHTDVSKLEEHGLVTRTADGTVQVPFDAIEIRLALFSQAARRGSAPPGPFG